MFSVSLLATLKLFIVSTEFSVTTGFAAGRLMIARTVALGSPFDQFPVVAQSPEISVFHKV